MSVFGKDKQHSGRLAWNGRPQLIVLLCAFLSGAVSGFLFAYFGGENTTLRCYLNEYFDYAAQENLHLSFLLSLWDCFRWPLAVLAASFHAIGVVIIPCLLLARGFLLSYAVSSVSLLIYPNGTVAGVILFFTAALFVLPVMLLFGYDGMCTICGRLHYAETQQSEHYFRCEVLLIGIGILILAAAVQWALIPALLSFACTQS